MKPHRFSLEKYSGMKSRFKCPECNKKSFTKYVDNQNQKYLASYVGKCSRVEKCNYHFTPRMYFERTGHFPEVNKEKIILQAKIITKPSVIYKEIMINTLRNYQQNNFARGLYTYFPKSVVNQTLIKYNVGTANNNKTVFWQVDRSGKVRTGKIILYNSNGLKRTSIINWVHSKLGLKDFNLKQVFFGTHLLNDTSKTIAITEGEKNAIFGALYLPQYIWIATGGINLLNVQKLSFFKGYNVILFPDKGKAYQLWSNMAKAVDFPVRVNEILEHTNLPEGSDIADVIMEVKTKEFNTSTKGQFMTQLRINPLINKLVQKFNLNLYI